MASSAQCAAPAELQLQLRRGEIPCRGVNLGGWLVAEHWLSWDACIWAGVPGEISSQGEFATMQFLGHEEGDRRFEQHRRSWVQKSDLGEMKRSGLNMVRVPVGFWILGDDPTDESNKQEWRVFAPGALRYLDELVNDWCPTHELAVLIDIHAAKGSQNGRDHSAAPTSGAKYWGDYPENVENTVQLARFLADRYRWSPWFLGLGLLNEPEFPVQPNVVKGYYERAYDEIRGTGNDCVLTVAPMLTEQCAPHLEDFLRFPRAFNVWVEWHPYFIWGFEGQSRDQVLAAVQSYGAQLQRWTGCWLLLDEWSLGSPDSAFPASDREGLRAFADAQLQAFDHAHAGWVFWTWRHSDDTAGRPSGWSMRQLLRDGVLRL